VGLDFLLPGAFFIKKSEGGSMSDQLEGATPCKEQRYWACRYAVLTSLISSRWHEWYDGSVLDVMDLLQRKYHHVLNELRSAGWGYLEDDGHNAIMHGCPPFGVYTRQEAVPCTQMRIMPTLLCPRVGL